MTIKYKDMQSCHKLTTFMEKQQQKETLTDLNNNKPKCKKCGKIYSSINDGGICNYCHKKYGDYDKEELEAQNGNTTNRGKSSNSKV